MSSHVVSRITEPDKKPPMPENPIDREKTCPLLLRVFCNNGRHHQVQEFQRGTVPANELQIYTWMDATLKELSSLVKEVNPDARKRGTYFDFAIVYPVLGRPTYRMREIGMTCSGRKGPDDSVTLASQEFTIGDYIDIAITLPPRGGGGGGFGGDRGGFGGDRGGFGGGMGGGGMGRRDSWGR